MGLRNTSDYQSHVSFHMGQSAKTSVSAFGDFVRDRHGFATHKYHKRMRKSIDAQKISRG